LANYLRYLGNTERSAARLVWLFLVGALVGYSTGVKAQTYKGTVTTEQRVQNAIATYRNQMAAKSLPAVSAHRGASQVAPENTLSTFRAALALAVDYIEIDVRTTKDGQLVILHDGSLNRTTSGTGPVNEWTLADLKKLSAGQWFSDKFKDERVPTLAEVGQLVSSWNARHSAKTHLYVDCKEADPQQLIEELNRFDLAGSAVFYASDDYLLRLKKVYPSARLMPSLKGKSMMEKVQALHPYAFDVPWGLLSESLVREIHQQGIKVFSDALENESATEYRKAILAGLDVIQTDYVLKVYKSIE